MRDVNMSPEQFRDTAEPWTFISSIDPITGESNYEYLEGWNWDGYYQSLKEDFPRRFHTLLRNKEARRLAFAAHGIDLGSMGK